MAFRPNGLRTTISGAEEGSALSGTVTIDNIVLSGVTRVEGSGGWNAPSKRTEQGFQYDSYVAAEPLEAQVEAWMTDSGLRQLQQLRESSEPFSASVDRVSVTRAKLENLSVVREGGTDSHRKVTIQLAEVREASVGTTEISISTPSGDMGTSAEDASKSTAQSQDDNTGNTDETTNENGVVGFLSDVREGLSEVL